MGIFAPALTPRLICARPTPSEEIRVGCSRTLPRVIFPLNVRIAPRSASRQLPIKREMRKHKIWATSPLLTFILVGTSLAAQPAIQISVDTKKIVRRIPSAIYGVNIEWPYNSWGMWDTPKGQPTPSATRAAALFTPGVIRFPGGTLSDYYHWRDGVGPWQSRTAPTRLLNGPEMSYHGFGTDEALSFASRMGSKLMITVNVGTGTAQEAADWVRYVNKNGRRVVDWELGNELYARTLSPAAAQITMSPETYAEKVREFAQAMRAADPGIRIGAIGGDPEGPFPVVEYRGWNRTVLERAGTHIDFLSVHNGYAPVVVWDRGESLTTVYRALLAFPTAVGDSMRRMEADIAAYAPPSSRDRIKLALTEWGPMYHDNPASRFVDHQKTLTSAVFSASMLKLLVESPRIESAQYFKLFDNSFAGLIGVRNGEFLENSPLYALTLFTRHFGPNLVPAGVTFPPQFGSPSVGAVPQISGAPLLEAVASVSDNGKTLYLIVINKSLDDSIAADVRVPDSSAPASKVIVRTLRGTGMDAHTGTQLPAGIPWAAQTAAPENPRFPFGAPGEVSIRRTILSGVGQSFRYTFPKLTVTAFEVPLQ